jgi:hypothetical protein
MTVTVGNGTCSNVVLTDPVGLSEFRCTAPPGPGFSSVQLRVTVEGSGIGSYPLPYTPPLVSWLRPSLCLASTACPITIGGSNLGLDNALTGPRPTVFIGASFLVDALMC